MPRVARVRKINCYRRVTGSSRSAHSRCQRGERYSHVVVQRAALSLQKKRKEICRNGIPVPGHKGMVTGPYSPEGNYIDVSAFASGAAVRDPYTGKIFLVP